jgi:rubrerythrin
MPKYINVAKQLVRLYRLNLDCENVIKEFLITAEPEEVTERKYGKWDKDSDMAFYWKCSECGAYLFWRYEEFMVNGNPHFCPYCGAQMESEREDE